MNSTILRSLLLTFVVLLNSYAFYTNMPTEPLLKSQVALAMAIVLIIFITKNNLVNLLFLWFLLVLVQNSLGEIAFPMLPAISPQRTLLVIIAVVFIFQVMMQKIRVLSFTAAEIAMVAFSVYVIFSMILSGTLFSKGHGLTFGLYLAPFGMPFFMFFISKNIIDDETKTKKLFFILSVIGLDLGITAMLEYFFPYFGRGNVRSGGPFNQPAVNGAVMGMLLVLPIILLLHEDKRWKKYLYGISIICLPIGILFTLTRSAWSAGLVGIFTMPVLIPKVRKPFFISFLIIGFISLLAVNFLEIKTRKFDTEQEFIENKATLIEKIVNRTTTKQTVDGRKELYRSALRMFFKKPFFGYGYGAYSQSKRELGIEEQLLYGRAQHYEAKKAAIHGTLMGLLVDLGLAGFSLYLFIIVYILNVCRKLYLNLPRETFLGKDLIAVYVAMFIIFFLNTLFFDIRYFPFPNSLFFCIAGIAVGLNQRILKNEIKLSTGVTA